jgi:hypothetical protein
MELGGGYDRSLPGSGAQAGPAGAIVITAVAALGTFIGIVAVVLAQPVFERHPALTQRQTNSAPVSPDTPAVPASEAPPVFESTAVTSVAAVTSDVPSSAAQPLGTTTADSGQHTMSTNPVAPEGPVSVIERTSVKQASRKAAQSGGAAPDLLTFLGALSVQADVAGAAIYVDGQLAGFTSIIGWPVAAGSHVVRIELEGYQRWSAVSRIVADETNHLVAKLSPIEQN